MVISIHSPDEVLAMAAESWLFEESSGELVIADLDDVFQTESSSSLVPCRQPGSLVVVAVSRPLPRVRQTTTRVAAAAAAPGVHCPLQSGHGRR